ncbi:MAG: hypothetical protein K2W33_10510 [Burkholderiales bacterium]|nr:hypothetical protein [Burkholderiales bacterium]
MSARMTVRLWVVALGVACLTACYQPKPVVHAVLQISADGAYTFQGKPVNQADLAATLVQAHASEPSLMVELRPATGMAMAPIDFAVQAVKASNARLSFSREPVDLTKVPGALKGAAAE